MSIITEKKTPIISGRVDFPCHGDVNVIIKNPFNIMIPQLFLHLGLGGDNLKEFYITETTFEKIIHYEYCLDYSTKSIKILKSYPNLHSIIFYPYYAYYNLENLVSTFPIYLIGNEFKFTFRFILPGSGGMCGKHLIYYLTSI